MQNTRLDRALSTLRNMTEEIIKTFGLREIRGYLTTLRSSELAWPGFSVGDTQVKIPVIQGGMGVGISLSGLASAVANAGGIGVIAANGIGLLERDYFKDGRAANLRALRREIRSAREQSSGVIGVNIMVAVDDFRELLDVAIEERVDVVFMGAGLPIKNIPVARMRENGVKAAPIVSSARAAGMIFRMWEKLYGDVPDAVVCEGPLAGGHLGFSAEQISDPAYQLDAIVPPIVAELRPFEEALGRSIPVIAAGGIYTGGDVHDALRLGAAAVQMGTRFVATDECDADERFKQAYVECTEDQIGLIKSPVGMPGRAIRNQFIVDAEEGRRPSFRCAWQCLAACKAEGAKYCISLALNFARKGKLEKGFVFAGSNAFRVDRIVPVAELIGELRDGFVERAREAAARRLEGVVARVAELRRRYETGRAKLRDVQSEIADALSEACAALESGGGDRRGMLPS